MSEIFNFITEHWGIFAAVGGTLIGGGALVPKFVKSLGYLLPLFCKETKLMKVAYNWGFQVSKLGNSKIGPSYESLEVIFTAAAKSFIKGLKAHKNS